MTSFFTPGMLVLLLILYLGTRKSVEIIIDNYNKYIKGKLKNGFN
jgi:hypothetical protein